MSAPDFAERLDAQGSCVVKGLITAADAAILRKQASDLFAEMQEKFDHGLLPEETAQPFEHGSIHFDSLINDPALRDFAFGVLKSFANSPAFPALQGILSENLTFPLRACALRLQRVDKPDAHLPFHQDVGFMTDRGRAFNCWITLDGCGVHAPGLELVDVRLKREETNRCYRKSGQSSYFGNMEVDDSLIRQRYADHLRHPALNPGDAIIFDQFVFHRTYITPAMSKPRMNLEVRICAADAPPNDYHFPEMMIAKPIAEGVVFHHTKPAFVVPVPAAQGSTDAAHHNL